MVYSRSMRAALVLAFFYANCPGPCGYPDPDDACDAVEGAVYYSVDELECGLAPDGPVLCNWSIQFAGGEFNWQYSDVGQSGTYTCDGFSLTGTSGGAVYSGQIDPETWALTWDGISYTR